MHVRNPHELGMLIRERRRSLSLSQAELATRIGVSRQWVIGVEAGKPGVELGLVLDAIAALDLVCSLRPREAVAGEGGPEAQRGHPPDASHSSERRPAPVSIERILSRTRASSRSSGDRAAGSGGDGR